MVLSTKDDLLKLMLANSLFKFRKNKKAHSCQDGDWVAFLKKLPIKSVIGSNILYTICYL